MFINSWQILKYYLENRNRLMTQFLYIYCVKIINLKKVLQMSTDLFNFSNQNNVLGSIYKPLK